MRILITCCLVVWFGTALAEPIVVEDRRGPQHFDAVPERIAVLDWALAQQVLDLGVVPVAVPEIGLYREWVSEPAIPEGVTDIGLRDAPDLERLASISPDVIVVSDAAEADVARLQRIAPVLVFDAFDAEHDNIAAARRIYLTLARLLEREDLANARLAEMAREIEWLANDLRHGPHGDIRRVAVIRLIDLSTVWIYGENSFAEVALHRLGLLNTLPQPASRWGVTQRSLDTLAQVDRGAVLAIRPHGGGTGIFNTAIWQFMPFVQTDYFAEVPPVWSYGGILSLGRHARAFHTALTGLAS